MLSFRLILTFLALVAAGFPQVPLEAPIRFFELMPNTPATIYALPDRGLLRSTDGGATWTQVPILAKNAQPPLLRGLVFSPQSANTIYVCGDPIAGSIVWKTVDGGLNWTSVSQGLPTQSFRRCERIQAFGNNLYLQISSGINTDIELWKSTNGGQSWTRLSTTPKLVAISPSNPTQMYYPLGYYVYASQNEGGTFGIVGQVRQPSGGVGDLNGVNAVAVHPTKPAELFATMTGSHGSANGIFRSTNGGASWVRVRAGNNITVRYNPDNPMEIWVGDCCGNLSVDRSTDGGNNWFDVSIREGTSLISLSAGPMVRSLPGSTQTVIGATARGLYKSENGGTVWQKIGTYSPWMAASRDSVEGTLLTRESTRIAPRVSITGAEDPRYSFPSINVTADTLDWMDINSPAASSFTPRLSARTVAPGQYETTARIAAPGAGNSPLELKLKLTVTDQVRNSFVFLGEVSTVGIPDGLSTSNGRLIYIDADKVYELTPQGGWQRIAGGGTGGDGGPATQANLNRLADAAFSPQGELFLAERTGGLIRKVDRNGILSTVVGSANGATPAPGMSPTAARFFSLRHLAFDKDGNLLFADGSLVWRVRNNRLEIYLGGGASYASGTQATGFEAVNIQDMVSTSDGTLYFTLGNRHAIFRLDTNNRVDQIAGNADQEGQSGDGGPAAQARLSRPGAVTTDGAGTVYFSDNNGTRVRRVTAGGLVEAVMGREEPGNPASCSVAEWAPLSSVGALALRGNVLYIKNSIDLLQVLIPARGGAGPPNVPANGVVHAASFEPKIGPGVLFSIFGERLATGEMAAGGAPWPMWLGNTAACLDGYPVPLFYTNTGQINGQAHYFIRTGQTAYLRVFTGGGVTPPIAVNTLATSPGVFQYDGGRAIAVNPDGRVNGPNTPASAGQIVIVYLSGVGALDNRVNTGELAPASPLSRPRAAVSATINGQPALMYYLGLTPGFIGLGQANVEIPRLDPGDYDLVFTVGGVTSKPVKISIR